MHWHCSCILCSSCMRTHEGFMMMQAEAMLTEGGGSMEQLRTAWKHIGDTCAWRGQWKQV